MRGEKYVYCIIGDSNPQSFNQSFGPIGINPVGEFRKDFSKEKSILRSNSKFLYGVNNREVNLVHYKDIAAVVSNTPIINFDRLDKKELTKHVATHQKVNEEIMKDYDVVPMAFGIIAPTSSDLVRLLQRAYLQFKTVLKKVGGKVEFALQVRWDRKGLLQDLSRNCPEIERLKQERVKLGKLLYEKTEALKKDYIKDVQTFLEDIVSDSAFNKLIDQDMLANFSLLLEKDREVKLDRKMEALGKKYEGKLMFRYIGPLPPYSFSHINLKIDNFETVDGARKVLGLRWETTLDEIKKAYRMLSHRYHPDKGGDGTKFKEITRAHDVLEIYCRSQGKTDGQRCSFRENDVKNSIIISKGRP